MPFLGVPREHLALKHLLELLESWGSVLGSEVRK